MKIFSDHLTVESPGTLPGTVRLGNLRTTHFSRNPKIANVLHEYGFVKEFGEGINRIYEEMEAAGLPAPEYKQNDFMLRATLRKVAGSEGINGQLNGQLNQSQNETLEFIRHHGGWNTTRISEEMGKPFRTIDKHIRVLLQLGRIERRGSKKTGGYYVVEDPGVPTTKMTKH